MKSLETDFSYLIIQTHARFPVKFRRRKILAIFGIEIVFKGLDITKRSNSGRSINREFRISVKFGISSEKHGFVKAVRSLTRWQFEENVVRSPQIEISELTETVQALGQSKKLVAKGQFVRFVP